MQRTEFESVASQLLHTHGLHKRGWRVESRRLGRRLGCCYYSESVIALDDYTNALSLLGYAPKWINAFVQWHFGGTHESSPAASPA